MVYASFSALKFSKIIIKKVYKIITDSLSVTSNHSLQHTGNFCLAHKIKYIHTIYITFCKKDAFLELKDVHTIKKIKH